MPSDDVAAGAEGSARAEGRAPQGIYPMRVAVQLTGLTPDTIRAWERRYHAIEPVRSAGNTRKFTQEDIRRLLLLREATEAGHSIGNIAELDDEALRALKLVAQSVGAAGVVAGGNGAVVPVVAVPTPRGAVPVAEPAPVQVTPVQTAGIEGYLELLTRFDVVQAAAWLRRVAALQPPRGFVLDVVQPVLAEVRERRADARLGGPHAIAAWQQLTAALHVLLEVTAAPRGTPEFVTVGAPRQRHAIHAMAAALLARHYGHEAVFLGVAVPDTDVLWAVDALGANTVVVDLSVPLSLELAPSSLATLGRMAARQRVWVVWPPATGPVERAAGLELVTDLAEIDALLAHSGGSPRR